MAWCLLLLTLRLASAQDSGRVPRRPQVAVRLYDYARLPSHVLLGAEREASRIFRKASVETTWVRCSLPGKPTGGDPRCNTSLTLTDFVLALLPREMAVRLTEDHNAFGITASSEKGFATHARVFYDRVEELAERKYASKALVLGHVFAHELGHLMLGPRSHSTSGIMRVPWTRSQLERAHHARLGFTDSEVRRIHHQLRRRALALNASDLAQRQK